MKKSIYRAGVVAVFVLLIGAVLLAGCAQTPSQPATTQPAAKPSTQPSPAASKPAEVIKIKTYIYLPATHPSVAIEKWFWSEISKRTNGRVQVESFYGGSLGEAKDMMNNLQAGVYQAANLMTSNNPEQVPLWAINWQGYYPTSSVRAIGEAWVELQEMPELAAEFATWDAKPLYFMNSGGPRNFLANKPVTKIEDLKGLKVRTSGDIAKSFSKAGASTVNMPGTESFEAFSRGTVNAGEGTWATFDQYGWTASAKYLSSLDMGSPGLQYMIKLSYFKSLPPDVQKVIMDVVKEQPAYQAQAVGKTLNELKDKFQKQGVTFVEFLPSEQDKWLKEYVMPNVAAWVKGLEAKGKPAQKVFDTFAKTMTDYGKKYPQ